jgi:hypothetical protein
MAAKIIKGGGEVPARPLAQPARAPVIAQDNKKVMRKDVFSANKRALEIIEQGQAALVARQQRAVEEAEAARQQALSEQSAVSRQEAVEAILRAYKARGDRLAASRAQCLEVINGLMVKITGGPMTVPRTTAFPIVDKQLKSRRGRFAAVVMLPEDDVQRLKDHAPLAKALDAVPELQLTAGDSGVLQVSGGEIPLDVDTAARALCVVLGVPLPPGISETPNVPAAEQEAPQEEAVSDDAEPEHHEGTLAQDLEGDAPEELPEEEAAVSEEPVDDEDPNTGALDEEEGEHADVEADFPSEEDAAAFGPVDTLDALNQLPDSPDPNAFADDEDSTSGTLPSPVRQERSVISRNPGGSAALLPPLKSGRAEGTRVEASVPTARGRTNALPLEERSSVQRTPSQVSRGHGGASEERSGTHRPPPPPRHDFVDEEDPSAATVAISRADIAAAASQPPRRPPPPPPPSRPPVDGTRVDVRGSVPASGLVRKIPPR